MTIEWSTWDDGFFMSKWQRPVRLQRRWQTTIDDYVIALSWSADGTALVAASSSGPIAILAAADGRIVQHCSGHANGTTTVSCQPSGSLFASGGQDGHLCLWNLETGQQISRRPHGKGWIERVVWSPRGKHLAMAAGKKLYCLDKSAQILQTYEEHPSSITDIVWSTQGDLLASSSYGGVRFFNVEQSACQHYFAWQGAVQKLAWSPDGTCIAGGALNASVHFWYYATGYDLEMTGYPRKVNELSWSADSRFLATGGGDTVMIWDCSGKGPAGSEPIPCEGHQQAISAVHFHHKVPLLASTCEGGSVFFWNSAANFKLCAQAEMDQGISQFTWSPTQNLCAFGGDQGAVSVWYY